MGIAALDALKKFTAAVIAANTGTASGSWAAGNDSRITGSAQKASNLSDLANAGTARTNLGLGNSATKSVGAIAGTVAAGDDARIVGAAAKADPILAATLPATATLGAELITGAGWTLGAGWSGDFATGFIHTPGSTATLTWAAGTTGTKTYLATFTVSSTLTTANELSVSIGNSAGAYLYDGRGGPAVFRIGLKSTTDGVLSFTPLSGFAGTVSAISLQEVTGDAPFALSFFDSADARVLAYRASATNVLLGVEAGRRNVSGSENIGIGPDALGGAVSAYRNTAVGSMALQNLVSGSRNTAIGQLTLSACTVGYRNTAVGQASLANVVSGSGNLAAGADAGFGLKTGSRNLAFGLSAMGDWTSPGAATDCIAIGTSALYSVNADKVIGIGIDAGRATTAALGIGIGTEALYSATASDNVMVGHYAGRNVAGGERNVAIGTNAAKGPVGSTAKRNVVIGHNAGAALDTGGDYNTFVGSSNGYTTTTGASNILIGYAVVAPAADTSNHLNIGNVIYGAIDTKRIGLGTVTAPTARLHLPASTTAASSAPLKLNTGVLMTTPEAGAIEFDGTSLYYTTGAGARKTLAVVA